MKINVIGLGYIGLPTAVMLASSGAEVVGVDIKKEIVEKINKGICPLQEPLLEPLLKEVIIKKKLTVSLQPTTADVYIIAVPTPNYNHKNKSCNLNYVKNAIRSIIPYLKSSNTVIIESTIPPNTTKDIIKPMFEDKGFIIGKTLFLAHSPERVLPGQIIKELINNNRVVGGITEKCSTRASEVYNLFSQGEITKTTSEVAEMSKLIENTYRDLNIAFANELIKVCNKLKINGLNVLQIANKHPRVNILNPGSGVGGHCLAVDPYFILEKSESKIINISREINNSMPLYVVSLVKGLLNNVLNKTITIFGITYKPNVPDLRESPSLLIVDLLQKENYKVKIYDPYVKKDNYYNEEDALFNSDLLLCLVGHKEFLKLDFKKLDKLMKHKLIFDVANLYQDYNEDFIVNYGNIYEYLKEKNEENINYK